MQTRFAIMLIALFVALGIAGSLEEGNIRYGTAVFWMGVCLIISLICVNGGKNGKQ